MPWAIVSRPLICEYPLCLLMIPLLGQWTWMEQGGAPQVISWFIIPLTIDISPINHSYWSYKYQLSYLGGTTLKWRHNHYFSMAIPNYTCLTTVVRLSVPMQCLSDSKPSGLLPTAQIPGGKMRRSKNTNSRKRQHRSKVGWSKPDHGSQM